MRPRELVAGIQRIRQPRYVVPSVAARRTYLVCQPLSLDDGAQRHHPHHLGRQFGHGNVEEDRGTCRCRPHSHRRGHPGRRTLQDSSLQQRRPHAGPARQARCGGHRCSCTPGQWPRGHHGRYGNLVLGTHRLRTHRMPVAGTAQPYCRPADGTHPPDQQQL